MQSYRLESLEDMAGQEERIKGLETVARTHGERLATIEGMLRTQTDSRQHQWILPVLFTVIFGALVGLYGLLYAQGTKITAIMTVLQPQTALKNIAAVSADPQKAKKELAQVANSFKQLNQAKIILPATTINEATEELNRLSTTHQDLPETWVAIGQFITYRSQMISGWQETRLPLCDDQFHKFKLMAPVTPGERTIEHGPVDIHDCKIILDSPDATRNLSLDLSMANIVFTHCAVFYNGGPVVLVPVKVATTQPAHFVGYSSFVECAFTVSIGTVPSSQGMEFAKELLASTEGKFQLNPS